MSARRPCVGKRQILYRDCGVCGNPITTTADTPWLRQVPRDGKRQASTYYCSSACYQVSYKHIGWYDGKAEERRAAKEAARDITAKNRRYYQAHAEELREKKRRWYQENAEDARKDMTFSRKKRNLLAENEKRNQAEGQK